MKNLLLTLSIFIVCISSIAQNKKQININDTAEYTNYKLAIRMMPISLFDIIQPSLTIGTEYKFKQKFAAALDVSILIPFQSISTGLEQNRGFILKPSFRYYLPRNKKTQISTFVEPDFFWKRQFNDKSEWLPVYNSSGEIDYNIRKDFVQLKEVIGFNIKIGSQQTIFNDNLFLEAYVGIGVRTGIKKVWGDDSFLPKDIKNSLFDDELKYNKRLQTYSFTGGARLVFAIKY